MDHQPPTSISIIQTRHELVSPTLRLAHFLKPSTSSSNVTKPPPIKKTQNVTHDQPLPIQFPGWRNPQVNYKNWVVSMSQKYNHVWKKAGIYDAVINSTYKISKLYDLVVGFASNWCPKTKSFVFEWGECSVTLEDLYVLGGYSVLRDSVLTPVENDYDSEQALESLMSARRELYKTAAKKVDHSSWMKMFMNGDHRYEHEGFLGYWLSMFVFPHSYDSIGKHVVPIAVHLARGRKIALGPAVLASIYRDLSTTASKKGNGTSGGLKTLVVWAPFQLVQVWIWERFVHLRPKWYTLKPVEPRMARWVVDDKAEVVDTVELRHLDWNSFGDKFQWRPYASKVNNNIVCGNFYGTEITCVDGDDEGEVLQSFARCLRPCELVGIDCIEQYLPHRVAMQLGFDQEIPADVKRSNGSPQVAWESYSKHIDVTDVFIPSPDASPGVTASYLEWRKQIVNSVSIHVSKDKSGRTAKAKGVTVSQFSKTKKMLKNIKAKDSEDGGELRSHLKSLQKRPRKVDSDSFLDPPPGFESSSTKRKKIGESLESRLNKMAGQHRKSNDAVDDDLPLDDLQEGSEDYEDHIPISQRLLSIKKHQRPTVIPNNSKTSSMMSGTHFQISSGNVIIKKDNPGMEFDLSSDTDEVPLSLLLKEKEKCLREGPPVIVLDTRSERASVLQKSTNIQETETAEPEGDIDICASANDHVLKDFNTNSEEGLNEQQSGCKETEVAADICSGRKHIKRHEENNIYADTDTHVLTISSRDFNKSEQESSNEQQSSFKESDVAMDICSRKLDIEHHEEKEKPWIRVERAIELLETKVNLLKAAARARGHNIP